MCQGPSHTHAPSETLAEILVILYFNFYFYFIFFNNEGPLNCISFGAQKTWTSLPLPQSLPKLWKKPFKRTLMSFW